MTDEAAGAATSETIVLAGGCFWGVQGVYQHVEGVTSALSGYAGGEKETARIPVRSATAEFSRFTSQSLTIPRN